MPARACHACSIGVVAGAQKQFYVSKGAAGGIAELVRKTLGLKARADFQVVKCCIEA